jgi:hypothetical protein
MLSEDDAKELLHRLDKAMMDLAMREGRLITLLEFVFERIANLETRFKMAEYIWKKYGASRRPKPVDVPSEYEMRHAAAKYGGPSRRY